MNSEKGFDKTAAENRRLQALLRRREEENVGLAKKLNSQQEEIKNLSLENRDLKETINRAKDIRPWARPNRDNVKQMARAALLDIVKAPGGWVVKMGECIGKKFKRLRDIWLILTKEDWNLHDEFLPRAVANESAVDNAELPAPARAAARAPAPGRAPVAAPVAAPAAPPRTRAELASIEVLRAEWRMYPSMRGAIEEAMARFGIALEPT